jgi:hypothetical protein
LAGGPFSEVRRTVPHKSANAGRAHCRNQRRTAGRLVAIKRHLLSIDHHVRVAFNNNAIVVVGNWTSALITDTRNALRGGSDNSDSSLSGKAGA